ncbi:hypothetical protein ADEAN_000325400 [Angomonas deanei]|uniref:Uncharacterized protein n=1 Tax=Angomonas deanei TaxID=59799 RepID=A0A7G2C7S4_9TRYP|nr:hypothetical protein ADEAN_000325400 [Angomonas deanei]
MQSAKLDEQSMNLSVMSHSTEARSSSAKGTRRRSYSTPSLPLREPIPTRTSLLREQQNANKRRSSSQSSSRSRSGSVEKKARQQPSRNTVLRQRTPSPASGNKKKANPPGARAGLLRPNKKEEVVEPLWKKALQLTQSQLNQNINRTTQKSKPVHKEDRDVFLANQQQKFSRLEQLWEYHQGYTDKIKEDSMNSANHARPRSRSADREKKVRFIDPVISHSPSADLTDDADWSLHSNSIVSGKTRQPVKDSSNEMREVPQLKSQKGRTFLRTVNPNVVLNSSYPPKSDHSGLEDSVSPILMPPARSNFLKRQIEQYQQELQFSSATTSLSKSKQ